MSITRLAIVYFGFWLALAVGHAAPAPTPVAAKPAETTKPATIVEPEMDFWVMRYSDPKCEPDCPEWIAAEGKIVPQTSAKLQRFLADPAVRKLPLVLNSGGGSIYSALSMGRMLRKYKMDTAVGKSLFNSCPPKRGNLGGCNPDPILKAYDGRATQMRAYCASACPLVLLGGMHRVVDQLSLVGLHEPIGQTQPYVDHFWIKYRMVHGKKQIISRSFVKRTYMAKKTVVGITPKLKMELSSYIREMGGSLDILAEMDKAAPKDMNWISYHSYERERLGLVTANFRSLDSLVAVNVCTDRLGKSINCIHLKAKEPYVAHPFER